MPSSVAMLMPTGVKIEAAAALVTRLVRIVVITAKTTTPSSALPPESVRDTIRHDVGETAGNDDRPKADRARQDEQDVPVQGSRRRRRPQDPREHHGDRTGERGELGRGQTERCRDDDGPQDAQGDQRVARLGCPAGGVAPQRDGVVRLDGSHTIRRDKARLAGLEHGVAERLLRPCGDHPQPCILDLMEGAAFARRHRRGIEPLRGVSEQGAAPEVGDASFSCREDQDVLLFRSRGPARGSRPNAQCAATRTAGSCGPRAMTPGGRR